MLIASTSSSFDDLALVLTARARVARRAGGLVRRRCDQGAWTWSARVARAGTAPWWTLEHRIAWTPHLGCRQLTYIRPAARRRRRRGLGLVGVRDYTTTRNHKNDTAYHYMDK
jgi:hypothetical protein